MEGQTPLQNPGKPQRWGNYLKEFIMIFLAITLGFFVENLREDMAENELEKEFMQEIVENLKYDTLRYNKNFTINEMILDDLDSLRMELKFAKSGRANPNRLAYFAFKSRLDYQVALVNTSAMAEMKSSGILRLIRNKDLIFLLGDYYERRIKRMEVYRPTQDNIHDLDLERKKHFSMMDMEDYFHYHRDYIDTSRIPLSILQKMLNGPKIELLQSDAKSFESFCSTAGNYEFSLASYQYTLHNNKKIASQLIKDIKQEYKIN